MIFFLPNTIFFEKCIVAHFQVICKKVVLTFKPFLANLLNRLLHKTNGIKVSPSILQQYKDVQQYIFNEKNQNL